MTFDELITRYYELTDSHVDGRWSEKTLRAKVNEAEHRLAERARAHAEKEAAEAKKKAERDALAAFRGDMETFAERFRYSESDREIVRAAGFAIRAFEEHEKLSSDLAENYTKDPYHTMSWGIDLFEVAAKHRVASWFKTQFEAGTSKEEMLAGATREMMYVASSVARSSSPTSNLMEDYTRTFWVKMVGYLDGKEFY